MTAFAPGPAHEQLIYNTALLPVRDIINQEEGALKFEVLHKHYSEGAPATVDVTVPP